MPSSDDSAELPDLLERLRIGEIHGLNITIPHKRTVMPHLDDLTPAANAIGAVNTLYTEAGQLIGDNTDAPGFYTDLYARLPGAGSCSRAIVLGAGGSARAVVYALLQDDWEVTVAARRLAQADNLIDTIKRQGTQVPGNTDHGIRLGGSVKAINLSQDSLSRYLSQAISQDQQALLIVNTTPLGMLPETDASPWPAGIPFPASAMLYDLVYNPPETALLHLARSQGIPAVNGLGMLVEQAILSFERWTGCRPPRQVMYAAIARQISEDITGLQ
jgi:shikimate dehydrogenase